MKKIAFLYYFVILNGTDGTEATVFSVPHSFLSPAPFATVVGPSPGTWKWGGSRWQWLFLGVLAWGLRFTPSRTVAAIL